MTTTTATMTSFQIIKRPTAADPLAALVAKVDITTDQGVYGCEFVFARLGRPDVLRVATPHGATHWTLLVKHWSAAIDEIDRRFRAISLPPGPDWTPPKTETDDELDARRYRMAGEEREAASDRVWGPGLRGRKLEDHMTVWNATFR